MQQFVKLFINKTKHPSPANGSGEKRLSVQLPAYHASIMGSDLRRKISGIKEFI